MRRLLSKLVSAAVLATPTLGCTHNVDPKVTPEKVATVRPPIKARVVLLIAPAFETYATESQEGLHHFVYHLGQSASIGVQDVVKGSFSDVDVEHVGDAEVLKWLTTPGDTTKEDVLLVPNFAHGDATTHFASISSDVRIRMDVRCYRSGSTYSWITSGHTSRFMSSRKGLTGSSLEQALNALTDTLGANRAALEVVRSQ